MMPCGLFCFYSVSPVGLTGEMIHQVQYIWMLAAIVDNHPLPIGVILRQGRPPPAHTEEPRGGSKTGSDEREEPG